MSTPTSLGEAGTGGGTGTGTGTGTGGSQESVRSGVRPRLQRQMAQSRKTFRFRKSKHGHSEVRNFSHCWSVCSNEEEYSPPNVVSPIPYDLPIYIQ